MADIVFKDESYQIIGAAFAVYNEMGAGFLEAVYQECLAREFIVQHIPFIEKPRLRLAYKGQALEQEYEPDFLCYNEIMVEIKAAKQLADEHRAQTINYLRATHKPLGLLINFGSFPKLEYERFVNQADSRHPRDS